MNRLVACLFAASLPTLLVACAADSGGPSAPSPQGELLTAEVLAPAADIAGLCASFCAWKDRCAVAPSPTCRQGCEDDVDASRIRPAYATNVGRCFDALSCGGSDDRCFQDYALGDPSYPAIPVVQACLARRTECKDVFYDDRCHEIAATTDAARVDAEACLAKPCAEIGACLRTAGGL